jgi:hypothetical protein
MNTAVRETIASRLKQEMARKGVNPLLLARESELSIEKVQSYLSGTREIKFDELRPICDVLSLRLMRLIGPDFAAPKLQFRNAGAKDRAIASAIENAFLLVADLLPKPRRLPGCNNFNDGQSDIGMLLAEIKALVEDLRGKYPSVESLYKAIKLPILPIHAGEDAFDAFLMSVKSHATVCINADKPPIRIHFSLLHEAAHFILHENQEIPIDILPKNLYSDSIEKADKPEYVANKFAQLYLISFADAEQKAWNWRNLENQTDYLADRRTGPDVLTNALYDVLRLRDKNVRYNDIRAAVSDASPAGYGRGATSILDFIESQGKLLKEHIRAERKSFSDAVWSDIACAWEITHD